MGKVQKSRVTLLDIAADADVSGSTASLVIRNVPSVAETTRKRVLHGESSKGSADFGDVFPAVAFARRVPGLDYVGIDDEQGALLAIEHLYRIGRRQPREYFSKNYLIGA
jgi:DNA-binding LacI/PurR family transcriptional regulator